MRITELDDLTIGNHIILKVSSSIGYKRIYYCITAINYTSLECVKTAPSKYIGRITRINYSDLFDIEQGYKVHDNFMNAKLTYPEDFI